MKYKCNICNKEFHQKSNYEYHIRRKRVCKPNNEKNNAPNNNQNEASNDESFSNHNVIIDESKCNHNVILQNDNMYECLICYKKYTRRQNLYRHKNINIQIMMKK